MDNVNLRRTVLWFGTGLTAFDIPSLQAQSTLIGHLQPTPPNLNHAKREYG